MAAGPVGVAVAPVAGVVVVVGGAAAVAVGVAVGVVVVGAAGVVGWVAATGVDVELVTGTATLGPLALGCEVTRGRRPAVVGDVVKLALRATAWVGAPGDRTAATRAGLATCSRAGAVASRGRAIRGTRTAAMCVGAR
jgi:hypothetical protein